jgi:Ca-activated chloride channel family protein
MLLTLFVAIASCDSDDSDEPPALPTIAASAVPAPMEAVAPTAAPVPDRARQAAATERAEPFPRAIEAAPAPPARSLRRSAVPGPSQKRSAPQKVMPDLAPRAHQRSSAPLQRRSAELAATAKQRAAAEALRGREQAEQARRTARASALTKDLARRGDEPRLPFVPRHDADDRFAELRILEHSSVSDMTFYDYGVNPTIATDENPVSTFAVDVDSASYGVARSYLQKRSMPDEAAIRVEEMINAFDYAYAAPEKEPFLVQAEAFPSPNRKGYHVLHVGIKGRELSMDQRKPAALVFVVDVSGSMEGDNRLGLAKRSLTMLTRQLDGRDSVGVVVYGSNARAVLEPTRASQEGKRRIVDAIAGLSTEGSTNVEAGLELGYAMAARQAGTGASARVILCSDGVANVGATAAETILARVKAHADRGVTISTIGFGMGNYNDVLMERLADKGNGNYAYVDNIEAAQRVFVEQLAATLEVIAKDVKIQVAFDKNQVARYRLLGFENRMLDQRDFDNDRVDAGEIGAGHTVTAMYEIKLRKGSGDGAIGTLRVRYKAPTGNRSDLVERAMPMSIVRGSYSGASAPTKLSMVVAAFAEKLRGSYWARNQSYRDILKLWDEIPESLRLRQDVAELRSLIVTSSTLDQRGDRFAALLPVAKMDFDRVPVLY